MNDSILMQYPYELADLMRERFGPPKYRARPERYIAADSLTHALSRLLTEADFAAFLQAALDAERDSRRRAHWSCTPVFVDHFGRALRNSSVEVEALAGGEEAWHIMLTLHRILVPDLLRPYLCCAREALENTVEMTRRVPTGV
ncbi:hypothetical protein ACIQWR_39055 [Streptomyces sp. NPDC098789]|uniref:hypothetical protein n=1 Tax=Streptomyces sp. NPDC098789 TaxID=3366098 RepID=UPI003829B6DD